MVWLGAILLLGTAAFWTRSALLVLRGLPGVPDLPRDVDPAPARVSLLVAARDEAAHIEASVRSILAQRDVDLEVVAINDRSNDATGEILDRLAVEDPRLTVVHVTELPPKWLGKCHALHVGAQRASASWLLFTDADVEMAPDVIARAVCYADRNGVDHLALFPGLSRCTFWGRATLLSFSLGLLESFIRVNRDHPHSFVGVGAFNLVRRDAYEDVGGHEALRLEIVDDLKLGVLMRLNGRRVRALMASAELSVPYAPTPGALVRVLEKNLVAMMRFSPLIATVATGVFFCLWLGTVAAPLIVAAGLVADVAPLLFWPSVVASVAVGLGVCTYATIARRIGWGRLEALAAPAMVIVAVVAVTNSCLRAFLSGSVRWRETRYPLGLLREHLVSPAILRQKAREHRKERGRCAGTQSGRPESVDLVEASPPSSH